MAKQAVKSGVGPAIHAEVKVSLPEADVARALEAFSLKMSAAQAREIYFFDTPAFELSDSGLVLRARKTSDNPDDNTVKLRPMSKTDVAAEWLSVAGFKHEVDIVGARQVESCSLTRTAPRNQIENVVIGERSIDRLFSKAQHQFILDHVKSPLDWARLSAFGPIQARVWTPKPSEVPMRMTIELWRLPNNRRVLEFSSKGPASDAPGIQKALDDFLATRGFRAAEDGDTKTRLAVRFFRSDPIVQARREVVSARPADTGNTDAGTAAGTGAVSGA